MVNCKLAGLKNRPSWLLTLMLSGLSCWLVLGLEEEVHVSEQWPFFSGCPSSPLDSTLWEDWSRGKGAAGYYGLLLTTTPGQHARGAFED